MTTRRALLAALCPPVTLLALSSAARGQQVAVPPELTRDLAGARLQGQGRLSFLGLHIYDARLWVGETPLSADWHSLPLALELIYARTLKGELIAERSLKEMKRQADLPDARAERWLGGMKQLFPDVKEGDRITGLQLPGVGVRFFINGQAKGELRDAEFARLFFGIWLSDKTSEPALRDALLGKPR
jgi:hypothetical protein